MIEWIKCNERNMPTGEDHQLYVAARGIYLPYQCVGYWNTLTNTWLIHGEAFGESFPVSYFAELPAPPAEEQ